jgi:hypothetical protein
LGAGAVGGEGGGTDEMMARRSRPYKLLVEWRGDR